MVASWRLPSDEVERSGGEDNPRREQANGLKGRYPPGGRLAQTENGKKEERAPATREISLDKRREEEKIN